MTSTLCQYERTDSPKQLVYFVWEYGEIRQLLITGVGRNQEHHPPKGHRIYISPLTTGVQSLNIVLSIEDIRA